MAKRCPVCDIEGAAYLVVRGVPEPFSVLRCPKCQAGFSDVIPPPNSDFVDAEYPHQEIYASKVEHYEQEARRYLRLVQRVRAGGRLLDVGCGVGFFLRAARDAGFDIEGMDVSATAVRAANQRLGSESVRVGTSMRALPAGRTYDVITFWNSLEHMPDPIPTLEQSLEYLRPGGYVVLEVPVDDALINRLHHVLYAATGGRFSIASRLYSRTLDGHMCLFTAKSFRLLEQRMPLRIVHEERCNTDVDELLGKHDFGSLKQLPTRLTLHALMGAATLTKRQNRLDVVFQKVERS